MDGFNVIPVDKDSKISSPIAPIPGVPLSVPMGDNSVEIIDESKQAEMQKKSSAVSWFFVLSILTLVGVIGYFIFLVLYRISMLQQVSAYGVELRNISKNIDLKEMKEFQDMDTSLKAINGKLAKHVLNYQIMRLVNMNIRNTLQVSEYRLDVKEKVVEVNVTAVSPSFKELAEQTEKFYSLRSQGVITSFSVSGITFESETKRIKFTTKLIFDKSKVTASAIATRTGENNP